MTSGRQRVRWRSQTVLGWAMLVVVGVTVAGLSWALLSADTGGSVTPVPALPTATAGGEEPPLAPAGPPPAGGFVTRADQDPGFDRTYETCVAAFGFDPGGVQVLLGDGATPWAVKTGRDVPAAIHRPCFRMIGGADPQRSSHGNP